MSNIALYGNRHSGHSYKVKLFLALTNTPQNYQTIDLFQVRAERPALFRQHARFGEVPLLIMDGQAFVQSNAILLHLSQTLRTMDGDNSARINARIHEWLMWEQSRLGFSLPNLRFERKFKTDTDAAVLSWLEVRLRNDLDVLNTHLGGTDNFVASTAPSIADCSLAGYLYWLGDAGLSVKEWPMVQAWLGRISALDGWAHPDELMLSAAR